MILSDFNFFQPFIYCPICNKTGNNLFAMHSFKCLI